MTQEVAMRPSISVPVLRDTVREIHRELASRLLAAAMLSPVVAAAAGWPAATPLGVPRLVHGGLLIALALAAFGATDRDDPTITTSHWTSWLPVLPLAAVFAIVVRHRANFFYTEQALIDGMALLFTLHVGVAVLRRRARRRSGVCRAEPESPHRWQRGAEWRRRIRARCLPLTPGMQISNTLGAVLGWILLASWTLIAFAHRHPAGPLLLAAGAVELLALLALVPDALRHG